MTQVTGNKLSRSALITFVLFAAGSLAYGQPDAASATAARSTAGVSRPAQTLYLQLGSVGLDAARTYRIRGASVDRSVLHITLEDGEISFTAGVDGHVTGALFEGDGEVLLTPPNRVERSAMGLFTGMAILEERFATAYMRFNDDTFDELKPYLRPAEDAQEFTSHWNETARNLAEFDSLRLLVSFSRSLPTTKVAGARSVNERDSPSVLADRMLHARVQGLKLGTFDVYYDSSIPEQTWAGQTRAVAGVTYYDLWTSFTSGNLTTPAGPSAGSGAGADEVAISRYVIKADVKPPTTLSAEASLQVEVRHGGGRTLLFELSRFLQVKQVDVDGEPVEFINNTAIDGTQLARRGNDVVAVAFPEPLRTGQKFTLRFVYAGEVLSEAGGGLLYVGARGTWYPNRGLAMADFDLDFRYPPGWTLLATGKRVAGTTGEPTATSTPTPSDPGWQTARWVSERPSEVAGFNLGKYERATAQAGGVTVETYATQGVERTFPHGSESVVMIPEAGSPLSKPNQIIVEPPAPAPARHAQTVAESAARAVEFFSQRFGPYPYSSLKLTQMPGHLSQGWPGLVYLSSFAYLSSEEEEGLRLNPMQGTLRRLMLAHETAHQWWGDLVGWRTYHDQWIAEALANYCALMLLETEKPEDFRKVMEQYRTNLLVKNKNDEESRDAGPVTLGLRLNSSHFPNGYEAISYGRGTWLLHMLRTMFLDAEAKQTRATKSAQTARDEPFVRVLRGVRDRYAGKEIDTQELLAAFEQELPPSLWYEGRKSLDWFLEGWVQGVALPHFSLRSVKYIPQSGGTAVSGVIEQKGGPQDLVTPVPVYAVAGGKSILLGRVFADTPETPFRLTAPPDTKKIVLDPNQTLLTSPK